MHIHIENGEMMKVKKDVPLWLVFMGLGLAIISVIIADLFAYGIWASDMYGAFWDMILFDVIAIVLTYLSLRLVLGIGLQTQQSDKDKED